MDTATATEARPQSASLMRLQGKVAIITGGAQGIGRAAAELFAREGARVLIVDVIEDLVQKTAAELTQAAGGVGEVVGAKADVTRFESCEAAVKLAVEKFGKLDILVNNAGITKDNLLMRLSEADWDMVMDVNVKGAFFFTKAAIRPMMKAHAGRIVNIASVVGVEGNPGQTNYAASKGAIVAFTKACAKEFCSRNILVNAIAPGFIKTRMTDIVSDEAKKRMTDRILLGRLGEPVDIARVIVFLASEDASYITGQLIHVNGGMYV